MILRSIVALGASTLVLPLALAQGGSLAGRVSAGDLAIILPADAEPQASLLASQSVAPAKPSFDSAWYDAVRAAYEPTSVKDAFDIENSFADWRLVSFRVVPCAPLAASFAFNADAYCWPETRLVWQPIQRGVFMNGHVNTYFADDRAIHALYDVDAASILGGSEGAEAAGLLAKARAQVAGSGSALSPSELTRFQVLRNKASSAYLEDALAMRDTSLSAASFSTIAPRPEYATIGGRLDASARAFRTRMVTFLSKHAPTSAIKELTAFSLPEGRQPPLLDEWVFLQFEGQGGRITQRDMELRSAKDGRLLFNFGKDMTGTQRGEDERLHTALREGRITGADKAEIEANLILLFEQTARIGPVIADRQRIHVPNTSCVSCHKLNGDPFDFHNFSYLDDRPMAVTPRVKRDVELDLQWVKAHL